MPPRALFFAVSGFCLLTPTLVSADAGELVLGPWVEGGWRPAAHAGVTSRLGLTDVLAVDVRLGASLNEVGVGGVGSVGVIAAWDVLAWVPELRLGGGLAVDDDGVSGRVMGSIGVRRYVSPTWSWALAVGAQWSPHAYLATVGLTVLARIL